MVRRRKTSPAGAQRNVSKPETAEMVTSETVTPTPLDSSGSAETALPLPVHDESLHETLLESVSPEALRQHAEATGAETTPEPAPPSNRAANDSTASTALTAEPPASIVVPAQRPVATPAFRRASALDALNEVSETNATVVAFLRNEGSATLSHWRALTKAKSPADAVRLQVDEMQRAADASLTVVSTLAKRASRFARLLGRR